MVKYNLNDDLSSIKYKKEIEIIKEFLRNNRDLSQNKQVLLGENKAVIILKKLGEIENHVIESHLAFLDVHVLINGSEIIYYDDITNVKLKTTYDKIQDCYLYEGNLNKNVTLYANDIVIFTPIDAHSPLYYAKDEQITKIVFKFKI